MKPELLYFDNHASTRVDPRVVDAIRPYFLESYGNAHSGEHGAGQRAASGVEQARRQVARCISADPEDVIFLSGATEANNLAILGADLERMDRTEILVSAIEHASVIEAAHASGLRVCTIPVTTDGHLDLEEFARLLTNRVRIVSVGLVNNEVGTVQPIKRIGEMTQAHGALLHVDAAQALTAVRVDVDDLNVDFMSISAHKAYGPKGIGALYVAPGRLHRLTPRVFGGGQERGLRAGTLPTPLCVGFGVACELLTKEGDAERKRVCELRNLLLRAVLDECPNISVVGTLQDRHPGNLSLRLPVDARDVVDALQLQMACSTGSACHSGQETPSHVLLGLGLSVTEARRVLRIGVGRFNTRGECLKAAELIARAVETFPTMA